MAATFNWCEDNGAQTGSPLHGTTRSGFGADTHFATDRNFKNVDDCTANTGTAYSASSITAGNNSFSKYLYGKFSGSFNTISAGLWSLRTSPAGALATGLTLKGTVTSTYATPGTAANAALTTDYSAAPVAIGSGLAVNFSTTGPEAASPTSTLSAAGYTQYLVGQLQTSGSAGSGDIATITETIQYNEN
jgi:hypothetical protein